MGYMSFDNDVDMLTHRPERVHEHQWRSLLYYWGTRKTQETNKKNGVPATCLEVWMAGYSKDNKPSTDKVAEVIELGTQSNATDEEIITQVSFISVGT
ncbi:unnamed protein product [Camellia sinensis]